MEFPIENQEQFDAAIQKRLTKERQRWESERGPIADPDELEQTRHRVGELEGEIRTRDARAVLASMNVSDEKRQDRIIRLAEMPDGADKKAMVAAFKSVYEDMPEVFGGGARVKETALDTSRESGSDAPITSRAQIDANENAEPGWIERNWDKVSGFLSGQAR